MDKYQKTIQTFDAVAKNYWLKFKDFELYQPTYDWFCQAIVTEQSQVLEVACGPGNVSRYLLDKKPQIQLLGIDKAPNMIAQARLHNPEANYEVMDCLSINDLNQKYDAIMCGFCLPYLDLNDALELINNMVSLLKDDGVMYLSTTSGDPKNEGFQTSKSSPGAIYVHYHDLADLLHELQQAGMTITRQEQIIHSHNDQVTTDEFILSKKSA